MCQWREAQFDIKQSRHGSKFSSRYVIMCSGMLWEYVKCLNILLLASSANSKEFQYQICLLV